MRTGVDPLFVEHDLSTKAGQLHFSAHRDILAASFMSTNPESTWSTKRLWTGKRATNALPPLIVSLRCHVALWGRHVPAEPGLLLAFLSTAVIDSHARCRSESVV